MGVVFYSLERNLSSVICGRGEFGANSERVASELLHFFVL
jgi:hypothetical protein